MQQQALSNADKGAPWGLAKDLFWYYSNDPTEPHLLWTVPATAITFPALSPESLDFMQLHFALL